MSALIKTLFLTAMLTLIAGPSFAAGFSTLQVDSSTCVSASETEAPSEVDENGNPVPPPPVLADEEEEEPDCE